jgi:hypothetical protein
MATYVNATDTLLPGTAAPTPLVHSFVVKVGNVQFAPGPSGATTMNAQVSVQALAADGKTVVAPPLGWNLASVQTELQTAILSALDGATVAVKPVLVTQGGYNGS